MICIYITLDADNWYEAIQIRRSRRNFDSRLIEPQVLAELQEKIDIWNRVYEGARLVLVNENADKAFKGIIGSYGKVKGAPAYVAFIGDTRDSHMQEKMGYLGEAFVLEATAKGLGTCWVAGFFRRNVVENQMSLWGHEKILAITPIGYSMETKSIEEQVMSGFATEHKRKPLDQLVLGLPQEDWPAWIERALHAARVAPSAVNRQPWRFYVEQDTITLSLDHKINPYGVSKHLDCGIAMLHIEVAALHSGVVGKWELLETMDVARFVVTKEVE